MNETKKKRYTVSYVYDWERYYINEDNKDYGCGEKIFIDDLNTAKRVYNLYNECRTIELREYVGADDWGKEDWGSYLSGNSTLLKSKYGY